MELSGIENGMFPSRAKEKELYERLGQQSS
jgi:hypothetical protein